MRNIINGQLGSAPSGNDNAQDRGRRHIPFRPAVTLGVLTIVALAVISCWLGMHVYQARKEADQRALLVETARQGALNLTTIDYSTIDADIQRILDSATGDFKEDFQNRSQPFVDVVKQAQAKSVGAVTEAGLESVDGDQARVLVAVSVKTSNAGTADEQPRAWRMRIAVQKTGDEAKVSNVEFVP